VYTEDRGWVQAYDLHEGEAVRTASGNAIVTGLVRNPGTFRVYNMTVESDHVFYVGDLTALVHNTCAYEVHHIVARRHPAMEPLKKLLGKNRIGINEKFNKVTLPRTRDVPSVGSMPHVGPGGVHNPANYLRYVIKASKILTPLDGNPTAMRSALEEIGRQLQRGTFLP